MLHKAMPPLKEPTSILVSVPNWVGDAVMATPALRAIRQAFPSARIVHLMRSYVSDVLAGTRFCDEQVFWPLPRARRAGGKGSLALVRRLRAMRLDAAILLTNSFRSAMTAWLSGARRRIGYARDGRTWLLTDRLRPLRSNGAFTPEPALDYYNNLAAFAGCGELSDRMALATSDADRSSIDARLGGHDRGRPLVVLNPGANYGDAKCWPAEKYAQLSDLLSERFGARVVASLGPKEREIAARLSAAARRPLEIFVDPPLGLGPLKELVRRCDLLITNDTGPRHFAAAFEVPVVSIFGSSDPAWTDTRFAKERIVKLSLDCQPCMRRVCPLKHHHCMKQLEPGLVMEAAAEFLESGSRAGRTAVPCS